jgi:hypothetical protein
MVREKKEEKTAKKNLFVPVAFCALASLRLCVKVASGPRLMLKLEMRLMGNRMWAQTRARSR